MPTRNGDLVLSNEPLAILPRNPLKKSIRMEVLMKKDSLNLNFTFK